MIAATCVPWPYWSMPSPPVKSIVDDHAVPQRVVPRVDARVDHRHADARARQRRQVAFARPHLIGADALRRHVAPPRRMRMSPDR